MRMQGRTHVDLHDLLAMRHDLQQIELFNAPLQRSPLLGLQRSRLRGRGMDFDQVRAYQSGDDARSIDWRVTARTGEVHTKVLHEERERPTCIAVEQSLHLFFASTGCFKSVLAAQVASLFAWASLKHNDRLSGLVFDHQHVRYIPARSNQHSVLQLLQTIADANQRLQHPMRDSLDNPLIEVLTQALRLSRSGSLLILICNERHLNEQSSTLLRRLAKHTELILLPLSDPLEHELPNLGQAHFVLGDNHLSINTDTQTRQAWRSLGQSYQTAWQTLAQQLGAALIPFSTARPALEQLQALSAQHASATGSAR